MDGRLPIDCSPGPTAKTGNPPRDLVAPPLWRLSGCLDSVQAVRGVLAGEEDDIGVGRGLAGMHGVRGDVDHRSGLGLDLLVPDLRPERAFEDVDPLLVRMPAGTGAEPHSHPNEQWIYILEGTFRAAQDVVHLGEIEY